MNDRAREGSEERAEAEARRRRDVVVIGASAGGVEALRALMSRLPSDFPGTILVVLHVPAGGSSALPRILQRSCALSVRHAEEGDELAPGVVLIAPPDRHMIVTGTTVTLSRGPRENGHRPAVDVLFRSAAAALGSRVVGVILSGALDDGAAGIVAIKLRGGLALVQDPDEALHASMPRAAADATDIDHVLRAAELARVLAGIVVEDAPESPSTLTPLMRMEAAVADLDPDAITSSDDPGRPSGWTCPDCQGPLFEIEEGALVRFRCRVGHAWSLESLVAQKNASLETALWVALRALEEKASLNLDMSRGAAERGHELTGTFFQQQAEEAQHAGRLLRSLLEGLTDEKAVAAAADPESVSISATRFLGGDSGDE